MSADVYFALGLLVFLYYLALYAEAGYWDSKIRTKKRFLFFMILPLGLAYLLLRLVKYLIVTFLQYWKELE